MLVKSRNREGSGAPKRDSRAVALDGVTRVFGVAPGVVRVDLVVERGEVVLVRGPNGSGKSTLLRVIATALSPTAGAGRILGFDLLKERDAIRRRSALLGHRTRLYEDLTASENLIFACALHGIDSRSVPAALDQVGLGKVAGDRVRTFSQGMRQRTALARLLLLKPDLLLLDEPYAGLDREARQLVSELIATARTEGRTVVLATHDVVQASHASRTVLMHGGRLFRHPVPAVLPSGQV